MDLFLKALIALQKDLVTSSRSEALGEALSRAEELAVGQKHAATVPLHVILRLMILPHCDATRSSQS